jgi:hypothetical protein
MTTVLMELKRSRQNFKIDLLRRFSWHTSHCKTSLLLACFSTNYSFPSFFHVGTDTTDTLPRVGYYHALETALGSRSGNHLGITQLASRDVANPLTNPFNLDASTFDSNSIRDSS